MSLQQIGVVFLDGYKTMCHVWALLRYRNKLKGLPLEYIRMATVDEMEATKVTKEALQDLAKQLSSGRVNANVLGDEEVAEPPTHHPDDRYPHMEFSSFG